MTPQKGNRLSQETSPYLLQHALNPVDWHPWGPEALKKANELNKPIFLSIGYSACHWCHVMEHESFENEQIAKVMNDHFICIKVDREERPDLDHIYMNVVQLMTGHGGWPMSVFLTPEQTPIFGGTYFPPEDRMGMPGFPRILEEVSRIYRENPPALKQQTEEILKVLKSLSQTGDQSQAIQAETLQNLVDKMLKAHDSVHGGFGDAPKFPQSMALTFFLRMAKRFHDQGTERKDLLKAVTTSLTQMAKGGIYDHLAGGFARYSVDASWSVPHFEKMLYDNALLSLLYFEAYQVSQDPFFRETGCGVLNWVQTEMTAPHGGFYSSLDADSEGEEGKFYVWDPQEIKDVLGEEDGSLLCHYFGVDQAGNFEKNKTVLFINQEIRDLAKSQKQDEKTLVLKIKAAKEKLFQARRKRISPDCDEKILTSWNALMIRAFVKGFQVTGKKSYLESAEKAAQFILTQLTQKKESELRLLATAKDTKGKLPAYIDDYAFFGASCLDLFEATGETNWLKTALILQEVLLTRFYDEKDLGFFFTANDHEKLIDRPKRLFDASIPSGVSVALENLLRLAVLSDKREYREILQKNLESLFPLAQKGPMGMTNILNVMDRYLGPALELALVEGNDPEAFQTLKKEIGQAYIPNAIILIKPKNPPLPAIEEFRGLEKIFQGKEAKNGLATIYLCQEQTCQEPVTSFADFQEQLDKISSN